MRRGLIAAARAGKIVRPRRDPGRFTACRRASFDRRAALRLVRASTSPLDPVHVVPPWSSTGCRETQFWAGSLTGHA